jgi:hypothetical protein
VVSMSEFRMWVTSSPRYENSFVFDSGERKAIPDGSFRWFPVSVQRDLA